MRPRKLSEAFKSFVKRRDSRPGDIDTSLVDSDKRQRSSTSSTESSEGVQEYRGNDDRMNYDDANSIIGGHSTTREEEEQAHVGETEDHKTFSFSLPFSNPLANFDFPKFTKLFDNENAAQTTADQLEQISTRQEEEMFGNIHTQDNTRMRAVRHALTPNLPLSPKYELPQVHGEVVILGGYRGSILRDTKTNRRVWVPIKVGLNMRKIDLTVGVEDQDELDMENRIRPDGMLTHIGPVDVSRKLIRKLRAQPNCNLHEFGYDWRLSADINSGKLREFLRKVDKGKGVIVIAHSMGGLVAHHAMMKEPKLFRGLVYAGVPSACPNILGPLRYGDSILLSSKILTAQVNFLMRSSFTFLPIDGACFVDRKDGTRYDLDFFDVNTWIEYGLSPCVAKSAEVRQTQTQSEPVSEKERVTTHDSFVYPKQEMIPYDDAVAYLDRTLKRTKKFLQELEYDDSMEYPPMAAVYGCTVPTLKGARVDGVRGIKDGDYSDLIFGAGDGVIYHKSVMPIGKGFDVRAKIPSDRGHVSLLNDMEAIGKALSAILE